MSIKQRIYEGKSYPYGEARRLRYAFIICEECTKSKLVDQRIFIKKILDNSLEINDKLNGYKRSTGVLRTQSVANNYIFFCKWLNLLNIENGFIMPSSLSPFVVSLDHSTDFSLTNQEKLGIMTLLIKKVSFVSFLYRLKNENTAKEFIKEGIENHFVDSILEWLVDLDILKPPSKQKRAFLLSEIGKKMQKSEELEISYCSSILKTNIRITQSINRYDLYHLLRVSIKTMTTKYIHNIDEDYFPIMPLLIYTRIMLIVNFHIYIKLEDLINQIRIDSQQLQLYIFRWDEKFQTGYLKFNKNM